MYQRENGLAAAAPEALDYGPQQASYSYGDSYTVWSWGEADCLQLTLWKIRVLQFFTILQKNHSVSSIYVRAEIIYTLN